jgi:hypothetical protein
MQRFEVDELDYAKGEGWLVDPKMIGEAEAAKPKQAKKSKGA